MNFNLSIFLLIASFFVTPLYMSAQDLATTHAQEREALIASQQQARAALVAQLSRELPIEIAKLKRNFNVELRARMNAAKAELKVNFKEEVRAAVNDIQVQRAISNYVNALNTRRDAERASLRVETQESTVALRINMRTELRDFAKAQAEEMKQLLIRQRDERTAAGGN